MRHSHQTGPITWWRRQAGVVPRQEPASVCQTPTVRARVVSLVARGFGIRTACGECLHFDQLRRAELVKTSRLLTLAAIGIVGLGGGYGCTTVLVGTRASPEASASFVTVIEATVNELRENGWEHPVRVDPRPFPWDARSVTQDGLAGADGGSTIVQARIGAMEGHGLERGDLALAQRCTHVGGMGGLMTEPLTEEQTALLDACIEAFQGLVMGVSIAASSGEIGAADGGRIFRVLVFGSDAEMAWDVFLDDNGRVARMQRVMYHVSE